jgi:hypothetical protein
MIGKGFDKERSIVVLSPTLLDVDTPIRLSICSSRALPGDTVALVRGCRRPVILRRSADNYVLVREAYVSRETSQKCAVEPIALL